jgi:hypothetical protein
LTSSDDRLPTLRVSLEDLREKATDIDLVNQPTGTVGEDDWMVEMMLNMMVSTPMEPAQATDKLHIAIRIR